MTNSLLPIVPTGVFTVVTALALLRAMFGEHTRPVLAVGWVFGFLVGISLLIVDRVSGSFMIEVLKTLNVGSNLDSVLLPGLFGVIVGFGFLVPFVQLRLENALPFIVAFVTSITFILMLLPLSVPPGESGLGNLKQFIDIFAIAFVVGVLGHILISSISNPVQGVPQRAAQ